MTLLRAVGRALRHDLLLTILLLVLAGFSVASPAGIVRYPGLVDWPTMATLAGLLMLTKGVELSGFLHHLGTQLTARMRSERALALLLVMATAMLATVLTNDVALFVMVPLTLTLRGSAAPADTGAAPGLPIVRLVIFEALAANAGSALTPIGNPQNLYLWQQSHASFGAFTMAMLPLALLLLLPLLLLTAGVFSGRATAAPAERKEPASDRRLLLISLGLYAPFLALADLHQAPLALAAVTLVFGLACRRVLLRIDWVLLLVFMLMFIDLRLVAATASVQALFSGIDLTRTATLYLTGIAASQAISNVPATILLAQYTHDWRVMAYGVNVGGAGLAIGSLANIIALRMVPKQRAWLVFHGYSLLFLLVTAVLVLGWLSMT